VPGLDGVRALAIAMVLCSHSVIYDEFTWLRGIGLEFGYTGVAVFFVLSGYLITRLLLREERATGGISLRLFYVRRALRLFPALWLYLLVVGALWLWNYFPDHPWHSFVTSLLYVRNLIGRGHETDHLWSLSLEEQFYLIWPLIIVWLPQRNRARLAIALVGIVLITWWRHFAAAKGLANEGALYIRSDFRFDAPLIGCAVALVEAMRPRSLALWNATPLRSNLLAAGGLIGLLGWCGVRAYGGVGAGVNASVVSGLSVALLLSQTGRPGWLSRLFSRPPLVAIGKISYGIYLWQQLFLGHKIAGLSGIRTFPLGLLATLAAALVSFYLLEKPLLRLKDRRFHKLPLATRIRTNAPLPSLFLLERKSDA